MTLSSTLDKVNSILDSINAALSEAKLVTLPGTKPDVDQAVADLTSAKKHIEAFKASL